MPGPELILQGEVVDVISPFPDAHIHRIWGWTRSSGVNTQLSYPWEGEPNEQEFTERAAKQIASDTAISFGLIDKTGEIDNKINLPIVGLILLDYQSSTAAYAHIAGRRKAAKQIREAASIVTNWAFESNEKLQFLNAQVSSKNVPAVQVALGAGLHEDFQIKHLSISRGDFECQQQSRSLNQPSDSQPEPSLDQVSKEAEAPSNKEAPVGLVPGLPQETT